jgi:hypothetical protein
MKSDESSLSISSEIEKNLNFMVMEDINPSTLKSNLADRPTFNWLGQDCKKANNEKKIFNPPVRHSNSDIVKRDLNNNTKRSFSSGSEKYDEVDDFNFNLTNNQNKRFSAQSDDIISNRTHFSSNPNNEKKQMYQFGNNLYNNFQNNLDNDYFSNHSIENLSSKSISNNSNSPNKSSFNNFIKSQNQTNKNVKNNFTTFINNQCNQNTPLYFSPNKQNTTNENYNRMVSANICNSNNFPFENNCLNCLQNVRHFSQPVNLLYNNTSFQNQSSPVLGPLPNPQGKFQVKANNKAKIPSFKMQNQQIIELNTNKHIDNIN